MSWIRNSKIDSSSIHCEYLSLPIIVNIKGKDLCFFTDRDSENKSFIRCADIVSDNGRFSLINGRDIYSRNIANAYESGGVCAVSGLVYGNELYLFCSSWYQEKDSFLTRPLLLVLDQESLTLKRQDTDYLINIQNKTQNNIGYYCIFKDEDKYKAIFESRFVDNGVVSFRFRMATSVNLQGWSLDEEFLISPRKDEDYISRPSVIKINNEYLLAYSSKVNGKYHIEMKKSSNFKNWIDLDERNFLISSESSWENDEVCYPFIFLKNEKIQMLYNGNKYGKAGAGLAAWSE